MNSASQAKQSRLNRISLLLPFASMAALLCVGVNTAAASTAIADGGFESAGASGFYTTGQSIDGGSWTVTDGAIYIDTQDPYVYAGNNSVNMTLGNVYEPNSLEQTLSTTVGQQYTVNFYANSDSSNTFSLTENGLTLTGSPTSIVDNGFPNAVNSSLFVDYTGMFVANSVNTDLQFTATGDPVIGSTDGSVMIDNVSIAPTPEPGSIVLLMTGVIGVGIAAGRKRLTRSFVSN